MDELVGVEQIAELMGVTRQRVHQIIEEDESFPKPVFVTGTKRQRRLWAAKDIDRYWKRRLVHKNK